MKFKESLISELISEVVNVQDGYGGGYSSFEEDGPPTAHIVAKERGPWFWVTSKADYEGRTWNPSTDRAKGDPYSAHVNHDWVGEAKTAPKVVTSLEELHKWALLHTGYERQYTDVGSWGVHSGRWTDDVNPEGEVKLRVESSRRFQDVSPGAMTTKQKLDLNIFADRSYGALVKLLKRKNLFIREIAAKLLGRLGNKRAVDPHLIRAIDDEFVYVQEAAIKALGMLGGTKAIQKLVSMLMGSQYSPRKSVRDALVAIGEPALDSLSPAFYSENENIGTTAVYIVGTIGGNKAIAMLNDAITVETPKVRSLIIQALGDLCDIGAFDEIVNNLQHEDTQVQRSSVQALAKLGEDRAVEHLVRTLRAPDLYVRRDAADALAQLDWKPSTPEERSWLLMAKEEWDELISMGDLVVDSILTALSNADAYHGGKILKSLSKTNVEFTDPRLMDSIIGIYTEHSDYRRREAADALRCIPKPKVIKFVLREYLKTDKRRSVGSTIEHFVAQGVDVGGTLISILKRMKLEKFSREKLKAMAMLFTVIPISHNDIIAIKPRLEMIPDSKMDDNTKDYISFLLRLDGLITDLADGDIPTREKAVEEMGDIQFPSAASALVKVLGDTYPIVRQKATSALGKLGDGAVPAICSALEYDDYRVRMGAAEALGLIRNARVAEPLLKAVKDEHRLVRQNVAWALGQLYIHHDKYESFRKKVIKALTELMRNDEYLPVRYNAVLALGSIDDRLAVKPLLEAMDSPVVEVRLNASYGLVKMSQVIRERSKLQSRIIDRLIIALSDEVDRIRYNAADGLRFHGGKKALAALTAIRNDEDIEMRELVERGIEEIEELGDKTRRSWQWSVRRHYELRDPEMIEELIQLLGHDNEDVQRSAQKALGKFKQLAFDRLMEVLQNKEEYWLIREGAAGALGRIGDKRAVDVLLVTLKDEHEMIRCNSAWSLAELKVKRTLKALIEATKDDFWMVRGNAAAGIGKIGGKRALNRLLEMVDDEHPTVREIVASYIAQFKDERVIPALAELLKDDNAKVRKMAKDWIEELEKKKSKSKKKWTGQ